MHWNADTHREAFSATQRQIVTLKQKERQLAARQILLNFFHPFPTRSKVGSPLRDAASAVPGVVVNDVYETTPDFFIDVKAEQDRLIAADVVIMQHPMYWYSCPSLMKDWLDAVLEHGFAYGPGGVALKGKSWMSCITTGGGGEAYQHDGSNRFTIRELLTPFEQTAHLCGMHFLEPFVVHGTGRLGIADVQSACQQYQKLIRDLLTEQPDSLEVKPYEHR
jgi:glutathione-regulated potassium-efflux system ancillary protein KefG